MKKKVVILTLLFLLAVGSVVSAASVWGTYRGNNIIRLTVDGDPVIVNDVPAINYQGRTMVPIYLLQQAGVNYTWDSENKTVDLQSIENVKEVVKEVDNYTLAELSSDMKQHGVSLVELLSDGTVTEITYYYDKSFDTLNNDDAALKAILYSSTLTAADNTRIDLLDGRVLFVPTDALRDFYSGKITSDELVKYYEIIEPGTTEPTTQNPPPNVCAQLKEEHAAELRQFDETNPPSGWDGSAGYRRDMLIRNQQQELILNGC